MIEFQTENVQMPSIDIPAVIAWLENVARRHGHIIGEVTYRFCSDEDILRYNNRFLGHDYYTDIITFDDCRGHVLNGDIVISLDTVASNAEEFNQPYLRELHRVIVHGVLHLCGINDKGPGEREIMEQEEDAALALLSL
ncbi:MAG: rRNA maturation RNase YbeY [Clostridium sp.]|nr:rRNA maturation RNase YbeY [Prevotella sp.]MCM1429606.1 rRNA maturation RNase YbeY [Clostridium sp.]MCM1476085.1 rRNA maturation RNase YbeY [Muribaculaceae bacterium]